MIFLKLVNMIINYGFKFRLELLPLSQNIGGHILVNLAVLLFRHGEMR